MPLKDDELRQLAHLSRLELDEAESQRLKKDLERMMDMVRHVQEVDTSALEGVAHVHGGDQPLREDEAKPAPGNLAEAAAENRGGHVVVPKVIP